MVDKNKMNMEKEIWKDIVGYEGLYQVSSIGRVKSLARFVNTGINKKPGWREEMLITINKNGRGYPNARLSKNSICKNHSVHRLVAIAFLGYQDLDVDHINGIKTDNRIENLRYCTKRQNTTYYHQSKQNSSKYTGVRKIEKKYSKSVYTSMIYINGSYYYLGSYENEYDAHLAYKNKLNEYESQNPLNTK